MGKVLFSQMCVCPQVEGVPLITGPWSLVPGSFRGGTGGGTPLSLVPGPIPGGRAGSTPVLILSWGKWGIPQSGSRLGPEQGSPSQDIAGNPLPSPSQDQDRCTPVPPPGRTCHGQDTSLAVCLLRFHVR